jgi:outer membrane immunogenic protein
MQRAIFAGITALALGSLSATAADMPIKAPPPVVYNWTGGYVGLNLGYSWGSADTTITGAAPFTPSPTDFGVEPSGFIGGLQLGYNWQTSPNWLWGLEGDFQYADQHGIATCCTPLATVDARLRWFGTLRGRVGWVSNDLLLYLTGGLAYANVARAATQLGVYSYGDSVWRWGWTVGAGLEKALGGNWTGKIEYLYMDLGSHSAIATGAAAPLGPVTIDTKWTDHIFRVGVNYRFR